MYSVADKSVDNSQKDEIDVPLDGPESLFATAGLYTKPLPEDQIGTIDEKQLPLPTQANMPSSMESAPNTESESENEGEKRLSAADFPSFEEWRKKVLEEQEKEKQEHQSVISKCTWRICVLVLLSVSTKRKKCALRICVLVLLSVISKRKKCALKICVLVLSVISKKKK